MAAKLGFNEGFEYSKRFHLLSISSPDYTEAPVYSMPSELPTSASDALSAADYHQNSPAYIDGLPNELLSNIFGLLSNNSPSASRLLDEPTIDVTYSDVTDLKASSLVSKRWRQTILPSLYKYARFILPNLESRNIDLLDGIVPFLNFVKKNSLQKVVSSLILLVRDQDPTSYLDWMTRVDSCTKFWNSVFAIIDPTDLIIVAPPMALGSLTSCRISLQNSLDFDNTLHYLRLQRYLNSEDGAVTVIEENSRPSQTIYEPTDDSENLNFVQAPPRATKSILFDIRKWSSLLLNEGSFIKAYSTNEFWLKKSPSILPDLLEKDENSAAAPLISPTIREMLYISIFPMQSHFGIITDNFPRLDRIYVQLVPRNNILDDEVRMIGVDSEDLWMERNASYALLMRELFAAPPVDNYRFLRYFESGDAADRDAWDMAVEYVKRAGNDWKIAGDGLFVRDLKDTAVVAEGAEDEGSALPPN